ncbi:hypothetical protein BDZ91DRAFT_769332 [Kalaharituber pfeilii]|nr:hypothetical protein BDZ91DRAFT_769332 [Kalaharituber pfeilii]
MKVTAFQRAIGANSNSYGRFMKLRGPWSGNSNSTFEGATRFFKAREAANLPMPKKPKLLPASAGATHDHSDITTIHLDGEDTDTVPIYDSCDEIRKKIAAHLRKPGVTQAQFLRDVAAQFKTQSVRIQGKQLADFRAKSGALAGNTSRVYYGAYVYFEKCRLKEGKDKSKHRLEMEKRWSREGGVDIKTPGNRGIWVCKGEIPIIDQYGTLNILTK